MKTGHQIPLIILFFLHGVTFAQKKDSTLITKKYIYGSLSPKSVKANAKGQVFAQNMMYRHTITVYNKDRQLMQTIKDGVKLTDYGHKEKTGYYLGAPVEACFTHGGKYAWVSNYLMQGDSLKNPGCDECYHPTMYDKSYVYKINTENFNIEKAVEVGSVPKYIISSPDDKYVFVSNWSDGTVSVIDVAESKNIYNIKAGRFPRGLEINSTSTKLYVAVMGGTTVNEYEVGTWKLLRSIYAGSSPRHLCLMNNDSILFVSLNGEGKIGRVNLNHSDIKKLYTGSMPRSMELSNDEKFLYVVNNGSNTLSKVSTSNFSLVESATTEKSPIGVTVNPVTNEIWVACYSGSILVMEDKDIGRPEESYAVDYTRPIENVMSVWDSLYHRLKDNKRNWTASATKVKKSNPEIKPDKPTEKKSQVVDEKKSIKKIESASVAIKGNYYIVTGAFKNEGNASRKIKDLTEKGIKAQRIPQPEKELNYVVIGPYTTNEDAKLALENYNDLGNGLWIFKYQ